MIVPRFAIVGHPNKGKSSIVATLAEDDDVAISPHPGTTTQARAYPMRLDGETLYELVDTPGFQRARETLAWLEAHDRGAGERAAVVREFAAAHAAVPGTPRHGGRVPAASRGYHLPGMRLLRSAIRAAERNAACAGGVGVPRGRCSRVAIILSA